MDFLRVIDFRASIAQPDDPVMKDLSAGDLSRTRSPASPL
ncbi:hypothetical protein VAR608DRAFT_0519 [Variovorax sp. HW608]|nr:hypothetical protein VAR608DRAFT_0519 [Variovorax sp. HW608]